jgi:hypothetical protein
MVTDDKEGKNTVPKTGQANVEHGIEEQIKDNEKMLKSARRNASHFNCRLCDTSVSESEPEEK